jgi:hypothetical protein
VSEIPVLFGPMNMELNHCLEEGILATDDFGSVRTCMQAQLPIILGELPAHSATIAGLCNYSINLQIRSVTTRRV